MLYLPPHIRSLYINKFVNTYQSAVPSKCFFLFRDLLVYVYDEFHKKACQSNLRGNFFINDNRFFIQLRNKEISFPLDVFNCAEKFLNCWNTIKVKFICCQKIFSTVHGIFVTILNYIIFIC